MIDSCKGYHVQITARSEADLDPATIMKKVADSSGSKYSEIMSKFETSPYSKRGPPISPSVVLSPLPPFPFPWERPLMYRRALRLAVHHPIRSKKTTTDGAMPLKSAPENPSQWYPLLHHPNIPKLLSRTCYLTFVRNPHINLQKSTWPP